MNEDEAINLAKDFLDTKNLYYGKLMNIRKKNEDWTVVFEPKEGPTGDLSTNPYIIIVDKLGNADFKMFSL